MADEKKVYTNEETVQEIQAILNSRGKKFDIIHSIVVIDSEPKQPEIVQAERLDQGI